MNNGFGRVLSLAAGYFVFAVLVNMALYDTLESALPSIVNSFIWTSSSRSVSFSGCWCPRSGGERVPCVRQSTVGMLLERIQFLTRRRKI